jgi:hypothetical protein
MATSTTGAPFNTEPSRPDERKKQDLEPESYVDAVRENLTEAANETVNGSSNSPSSSSSTNGISGASGAQHSNSGTIGKGPSILRITNTHNDGNYVRSSEESTENRDDAVKLSTSRESNGDSINGMERRDHERRPGIERQGSKHEYSTEVGSRRPAENITVFVNLYLGPQ